MGKLRRWYLILKWKKITKRYFKKHKKQIEWFGSHHLLEILDDQFAPHSFFKSKIDKMKPEDVIEGIEEDNDPELIKLFEDLDAGKNSPLRPMEN